MSAKSRLPKHILNPAPTETSLDRITAYVMGRPNAPEQLSDKEEEQLKRWRACFGYLLDFRSSSDIVILLKDHFGIEKSQAYRDIRNCQEVFQHVGKVSKEAQRYTMLLQCDEVIANAAENQDWDLLKNTLRLKAEIAGLDKPDAGGPDPDAAPVRQVININMDFLKTYQETLDDHIPEEINQAVNKVLKDKLGGSLDIIDLKYNQSTDEHL